MSHSHSNDMATPRRAALVDIPTDPAQHLVHHLPLQDSSVNRLTHWAGHLPASKGHDDKFFFYWLFAPPDDEDVINDDIPLIIWLNGGPGCSSMDGLWIENGPLRLALNSRDEWTVTLGRNSWHTTPAYVLYIDQPVGTGLSFTTSGSFPKNDEEVNIDFYYALQQFLSLHADKFVRNSAVRRPVYFSGESHAGHYIPSMMHYILRQNDQQPAINIPLTGAAIGNGWMDPYHQYAAAQIGYARGFVDLAQLSYLNDQERKCQEDLSKKKYASGVCFGLMDKVISGAYGSGSPYKVSSYDARRSEKSKGSREFPPGHKTVEAYLGGHHVPSPGSFADDYSLDKMLEAIHATAAKQAGQTFYECTDPPYKALAHQDGLGVVDDVIAVLEHPDNIRLLFFNGMEDIICNHVGNEEFLNHMDWKGRDEWIQAKRYSWKAASEAESSISGYMKEYENLLFLKGMLYYCVGRSVVLNMPRSSTESAATLLTCSLSPSVLNAGHMVPLDVPEVALEMISTFVQGQSFSDFEQKIDRDLMDDDSCPICPTCDKGGSASASTSQSSQPWVGMFWLVGGIGACFAVLYWNERKIRRRVASSTTSYNLEMRNADEYRDEYD